MNKLCTQGDIGRKVNKKKKYESHHSLVLCVLILSMQVVFFLILINDRVRLKNKAIFYIITDLSLNCKTSLNSNQALHNVTLDLDPQ